MLEKNIQKEKKEKNIQAEEWYSQTIIVIK